MVTKVFGTSIKRREDPRLITGEAKYLEDIQLPGMAMLPSCAAHTRTPKSTGSTPRRQRNCPV